ncbi:MULTISPECIES: DUF2939 domain-containing protein [Alcanivorax]|jgi:hypothetical protein|uniref:DUF2939 domain-containing protein n=1 Tax=Alcanivorax borkumensis (strain ATCC 700651 / DSM 11573 / NCIMB 13689 / SK2) TaxID=393595 RepID=Q0VRA2_ALCBS|nr:MULTISPECIES: DUF2939 domain-containing protein [Alcanivorax]CAL16296.1 conserved hypothetical protein [Alcanivorax borkumensis SK2]
MSKGKVALGIALGLFAIYVVAAPFITVYQMKSAAENYDGEALSEHIEFPSVRQSLKDQMNVMFAKQMTEDEEMKDNPFAVLGAAFAGVMVDKMVDAYVTPAGITQLMAGEKPQPGAGQGDDSTGSAERNPWEDASMSYESFDKFVVKAKGADGGDGKFVLRRQGIGWKLTEIIIPLE